MPTTGVPVPGPKADGRERSGAWRAGSVGEDRSGRAGLEPAGVVHLTLRPSSFPLTAGCFSALSFAFIEVIADISGC